MRHGMACFKAETTIAPGGGATIGVSHAIRRTGEAAEGQGIIPVRQKSGSAHRRISATDLTARARVSSTDMARMTRRGWPPAIVEKALNAGAK